VLERQMSFGKLDMTKVIYGRLVIYRVH